MPDIDELLKKLKCKEDEIREEAAAALVGVLEKRIVPDLVRAMTSDGNPGVKYFAKKALTLIQKEHGDIQSILNEMAANESDTAGDEHEPAGGMDAATRGEVEKIFKAVSENDREFFAGLLEKLPFESNPYIRATIISAIGKLGDQENMDDIITFLSDEDFRVIANTVEALERLGNPKCVDHLIKLVSHSDNRVKANVVKAIWKFTTANNRINNNISKALREMLKSNVAQMRESAVYVLTEIADDNAVDLLSQAVKEFEGEARETAREALQKVLKANSEKKNVPHDEAIVSKIIENLAKSAQAEMSKSLDDAARDEINKIQAAIDAADKTQLEGFKQRLSTEKNPYITATLISAVGKLGGRNDMDSILTYLRNQDNRIVANTIEALESLGNPKCVESIVKIISHPDNRVRANAVKAVWRFAHNNVVARRVVMERLKEMMFSSKFEMRESSIFVLGEIADDDSIELLNIAANDKNPAVKEKAQEAITRANKVKTEREAEGMDEIAPDVKKTPAARPEVKAPVSNTRAAESRPPAEIPLERNQAARSQTTEQPPQTAEKKAGQPPPSEKEKKTDNAPVKPEENISSGAEEETPESIHEKTIEKAIETLSNSPAAPTQLMSEEMRKEIADIQDAANSGDKSQLEKFCERLKTEENPFIKATLITAIGRIGTRANMDDVVEFLEDGDARVVANTAEALENLGNSKCVENLIKIISHPDNRARANIVKAIWKFAHTNVMAEKLIMNRLKEMMFSTKPQMRESAIYVLGEIATDEAIELITLGLNDKNPAMKEKAQEALEKAKTISENRASEKSAESDAAAKTPRPKQPASKSPVDAKRSQNTAAPSSQTKPGQTSSTASSAVTSSKTASAPSSQSSSSKTSMPLSIPAFPAAAKPSSPLKTALIIAFFLFIVTVGGGAYYWFGVLGKTPDDLVAFIRGENVFQVVDTRIDNLPAVSGGDKNASPPEPKKNDVFTTNDQIEISKQYVAEGHFTDAINSLSVMFAKFPQNTDVKKSLVESHFKRGEALFNLEIYEAAKIEYDRVLELDRNGGNSLKAQSRLDKIAKALKK